MSFSVVYLRWLTGDINSGIITVSVIIAKGEGPKGGKLTVRGCLC
jgi:hypothetical protein